MADSFTANLNLRKPEVGAAHDTWGGVAGLNGDLDLIDAVFLATGLGTSVGLHVGSGKALRVEGDFEVRDTTDVTKAVTIKAANVTTGTKRTLQAPDMDGTIATVDQVRVMMPVGAVLHGYWGNSPPPGFVFADGRTIGDASSGATNRANADTAALFARFWGFSATQFPIQNPDGTAATRGVDAATDFAAHRRMTLPDHSGAVAAGRDNLSGTARGRLTIFGGTTWGNFGGTDTVQLTVGHLPGHSHLPGGLRVPPHAHGMPMGDTTNASVTGRAGQGDGNNTYKQSTDLYGETGLSGQTANTGSDIPHANAQPTIVCDVVIAL